MKKLFLVLACAALSFGASATVLWVGSCGAQVYTVGEEYFEDEDEDDEDGSAESYYQLLNQIYCGEKSDNYTIYR